MQLLSIFSGGLIAIDIIILAIAYFVFSQAKKEARNENKPLTKTTFFVLTVIAVAAWIGSIIWRALEA